MRILVVEDEPSAATMLAKGLREHAYAVDVAGDTDTALEQVGVNDYDLILLDVLLPRMSTCGDRENGGERRASAGLARTQHCRDCARAGRRALIP